MYVHVGLTIPFLRIYSVDTLLKMGNEKFFIAALFVIAQVWKQVNVPSIGWNNKKHRLLCIVF